jgi:NADPH:quinone reductase-like Zn-dependent oxidoreductase
MASMKAAVAVKYGAPSVLRIQELPAPSPAPEEPLVRTRFIGLNFADLMQRSGVYPRTPKAPFVPGLELAGEVVEPGSPALGLKPGDRVVAYPIFGSHQALVATSLVAKIPERMDLATAAAIGVCGMTAHYAINYLGKARAGETILVTAAAGGVGTLAIQIARTFGLTVTALAGGEAKGALARSLGAHDVIIYRRPGWAARLAGMDFDIVLDSVGGPVMRACWPRLRPMGRYILFGFAGAVGPGAFSRLRGAWNYFRTPAPHPLRMVSANRTLSGFNLSLLTEHRPLLTQILLEVFDLWEKGDLQPVVSKVYPFGEIARAHAEMQERRTTGKVLIEL